MKKATGLRSVRIALGMLFFVAGFSFKSKFSSRNKPGLFVITVKHFVGTQALKLDSVSYQNELGQKFTVSKFKYYIGNVVLKQEHGAEFRSDAYFLVNEEEEGSKRLVLENVPEGKYSSLEFIIGVDSLHNCSGAQSGALDPANGMFWAWNTGYIFLKLEGSSPVSSSPGHLLEYHIGGYRQPANCIRKVRLELGTPGSSEQRALLLAADLQELLKTPKTINFKTLSSITDFHNASLFADNYQYMFRILDKRDEN